MSCICSYSPKNSSSRRAVRRRFTQQCPDALPMHQWHPMSPALRTDALSSLRLYLGWVLFIFPLPRRRLYYKVRTPAVRISEELYWLRGVKKILTYTISEDLKSVLKSPQPKHCQIHNRTHLKTEIQQPHTTSKLSNFYPDKSIKDITEAQSGKPAHTH